MTSNALREIEGWIQDAENRRAYGSENIKLDLALVLAEARRSQGLTQKELADLAQVSQAYIAKLESGEANPTIGHIGAILAVIWLRIKFVPRALVTHFERIELPSVPEASPSEYEDKVLDSLDYRGTDPREFKVPSLGSQSHTEYAVAEF